MSKKLYVGGLNWNTTEDTLFRSFAEFGEVEEAKIITDRDTGRSRGFGFVTFSTEDAAENAIAGMDGKELEGRYLKVNVARERTPRRGGGGGGGYGGGGYGGGGYGGGGNRGGGGGYGGGGYGGGGNRGGGGGYGGGGGNYGGGGGNW